MSRDWLEHHQIGLYFVAVAIAAVAGLASEGIADLAAMAITPAIAVLMYAMLLALERELMNVILKNLALFVG